MPKRPRVHVLETESKTAVEKVLPPEWICRWESTDYGIDGSVEIVKGGVVTGDIFALQLKGTDQEGKCSVTLRSDTLFYYATYPVPILLVLYNSNNETLHARWIHDILKNTSPEQRERWKNQQTVTIDLSGEIELKTNRVEDLAKEVHRELAKRKLRPTVRVCITSGRDESTEGVRSPSEICEQLNSNLKKRLENLTPDRVEIVSESKLTDADIKVTITVTGDETKIKIRHADTTSTFLYETTWKGKVKNIPLWIYDSTPSSPETQILLAIAFSLGACDEPEAGAQILYSIGASGLDNILESDPRLILATIMLFVRADRAAAALGLAEDLVERGNAHVGAHIASTAFFTLDKSPSAVKRYREILSKSIDTADDPADRATFSYNLANSLRSSRRFREAISFYNRATKEHESYRDQPYWWDELGGCLFLTGHFKWAAEAYKRALQKMIVRSSKQGKNQSYYEEKVLPTRAKYADALLFSGAYGEALEEFEKYLEEAENPLAEWTLKYYILKSWFKDKDVPTQHRRPEKAKGLVNEAEHVFEQGDSAKAETILDEALKEDMLEPAVWELNSRIIGRENLDTVVWSQIIAAVVAPNLHLWVVATHNLLNKELDLLPSLPPLLIKGGYEVFGSDYVNHFQDFVLDQEWSTQEFSGQLQKLFRLVLDSEYTFEDAHLDGLPIPEDFPEDVLNRRG